MADIESKLIKSTGPKGTTVESSESRSRAAHHQSSTIVYELNSKRLTQPKGPRPKNYNVRDQFINSMRRKKGLEEIK